MTVKTEIASSFEALAAAEVAERSRVIRAKPGVARILKTETGKTVTHGQVLQGLLKKAEIELEVQDGRRPKAVKCEVCRTLIPIGPIGGLPSKCSSCKNGFCGGCGEPLQSRKTAERARKRGDIPRCKRCAASERGNRRRKAHVCKCGAPATTLIKVMTDGKYGEYWLCSPCADADREERKRLRVERLSKSMVGNQNAKGRRSKSNAELTHM